MVKKYLKKYLKKIKQILYVMNTLMGEINVDGQYDEILFDRIKEGFDIKGEANNSAANNRNSEREYVLKVMYDCINISLENKSVSVKNLLNIR